jgi:peptide/nickel transport system permease protein
MSRYVAQRAALSVVSILGVLLVVFLLIRVSGDPTLLLASPDARPEDIQKMRESLGLDRPLHVQFVYYLRDAARLDFGESFHWREPAITLVLARFPATLQVAAGAFLISLLIGIPVGIYAALERGRLSDTLARMFALAGQAMPTFWLGIVLVLLFSVKLPLFPTSGTGGISHVVLPAITLGWFTTAASARLLRSTLIDVLSQEYIVVAHSKGLPRRTVIARHALRNAWIPLITLLGKEVATLLSGSALVETVFAIPGVGQLAVQAVFARDYPVVQTIVVLTSLVLITANLVVDMAYGFLDPRIRLSASAA